jgi:lipoprotein-releasing system ATP-binding protein
MSTVTLSEPSTVPAAKPRESSVTNTIQLQARGLYKSYYKAKLEIPVLRGVDLDLRAGEFLAIIGQSGSGKSTLLHLLGTLDQPDAGEVHFWDHRIDKLPARARDRLRNEEFGMIFQFYHLLPELSAVENVLMPLMIRHSWFSFRLHKKKYEARAKELLDLVGLGHRLKHKPREMSGGEMQRTAIARALISQPQVLLADEPTGNLDAETGAEILELLRKLNREQKLSMIMVTHDQNLAAKADRIVSLAAGKVVSK